MESSTKKVELLTSIPSIGDTFAPIISLEIDNIGRFHSNEKTLVKNEDKDSNFDKIVNFK